MFVDDNGYCLHVNTFCKIFLRKGKKAREAAGTGLSAHPTPRENRNPGISEDKFM
jgi:hypothetical protein